MEGSWNKNERQRWNTEVRGSRDQPKAIIIIEKKHV